MLPAEPAPAALTLQQKGIRKARRAQDVEATVCSTAAKTEPKQDEHSEKKGSKSLEEAVEDAADEASCLEEAQLAHAFPGLGRVPYGASKGGAKGLRQPRGPKNDFQASTHYFERKGESDEPELPRSPQSSAGQGFTQKLDFPIVAAISKFCLPH